MRRTSFKVERFNLNYRAIQICLEWDARWQAAASRIRRIEG